MISLHDSERRSQPLYCWRLGLLRSPCSGSPAGSSDGGPDVRTHAHRVFFSPGLWYFRGTPTQSLSIPPLQYSEQTYRPSLRLKSKQDCIPVGWVPPAAVTVSPATHAPLPCMPPYHACLPCHTRPSPATHVTLAMHAIVCVKTWSK